MAPVRREVPGSQPRQPCTRYGGSRPLLVDGGFTTAETAPHAYAHAALERGIDLQPIPGGRAWLQRVESAPGWKPMAKACR